MFCRKSCFAVMACLWLSGCSALSPYSSQTRLDLNITASDQLNPDLNGRPSPMVLRLLELKHPVSFGRVDFFSLYARPKGSLEPDLVSIEELQLSPGEKLQLKLRVDGESGYVGVVAGYRDLPETKWRHLIEIKSGERNRVDLVLDHAGIHLASEQISQMQDKP
jgi:type VI secretion system protein VasD